MHPQLSEYKQAQCLDLIIELERCHQRNFMDRALGACNEVKDELSLCLRQERKDRTKRNYLKAMERKRADELRKKRIQEEEWGEDLRLKKVLEDHLQQQQKQQKSQGS